MNRLTFGIVILGASLLPISAAAQGPSAESPQAPAAPATSTFWDTVAQRVEIRQNTNIKKDIAQPAFITFTNPDEGATTYQIGLGMLASLYPGTGFDLDGLLDYQRNSAVAKEQDSFKAGVTGYWQPTDLVARGNAPLINFRTNFKNDGVKNNRGWQNAVGYTHLFVGQHSFPMPNLLFPIGQPSGKRIAALTMTYFPYVGLEFDSVLAAPTEAAKGTATRGVLQLNVAFYPAPLEDRNPVEILLGYAYRADLKDTTDQVDDSHPLFTFETNYFPVQTKKGEIGFGVTYKNGEDPDESFERQAFWQFTLKFRLKKP